MQFFREERLRCVRHLAGNRYSQNSYLRKTYVNLIALYVDIVSRNLISKNPRVMLSTFERDQKPAVAAAETWMNHELVRQDFSSTMSRIVLDALFTVGIAKVCIATPADAAAYGWGLQAGQPLLSRVDLDNWVQDHRADEFNQAQFTGHRYRMPMEIAMNFDQFDKKARQNLEISHQISYNRQGDERIGEIGRDYHGYDEDLYDMVDLWEFYLPQEKVIKTFSEHDLSGPSSAWEGKEPTALRVQRWIGPDYGPYIQLPLRLIPGNPIPKGPVLDLVDLHEMANEGYRKLGRQFGRLKKNTTCSRDNPEDGEALRDAKDGDSVPLHNAQAVQDIVQGGGDAGLFNWVRENITRFMEQAGNLATMGGLSPQASTLGQEELLSQQSNGQIASMQDATMAFVAKCADSMLWYAWHHPELIMRAPVADPRLPDISLVRQVHPWDHPDPNALRRLGPKPDIKIDPYSMRHTTPQQRVKDVMQVLSALQPFMQMAMQQGLSIDFTQLLAMFGKNMDAPDLQTILPMQGDVMQAQSNSTPDSPSKPASTERTYTRRSIGGQSRQSQEMETDNSMSAQMSGGSNGKKNAY